MTEMIPSKWMREYLQKYNRKLTDREKAAVLWNRPDKSWNEKLCALEELEAETDDIQLKKQLWERISYEKESFCRFKDNPQKSCVYLVRDSQWEIYGCFFTYEAAYDCAVNCFDKYKEYGLKYFEINKQKVDDSFEQEEYFQIEEILRLNSSGDIIFFFSLEEENFENNDDRRFEDLFFRIPCGLGLCCVKMPEDLINTEDAVYGIVNSTEKRWEAYMDTVESWNEGDREFGDIQVTVYYLTEEGTWSHQHISPLFLEPVVPAFAKNDYMGAAWTEASNALINYFKEETDELAEAVVKTAKMYAEKCKKQKSPKINGIGDVLL